MQMVNREQSSINCVDICAGNEVVRFARPTIPLVSLDRPLRRSETAHMNGNGSGDWYINPTDRPLVDSTYKVSSPRPSAKTLLLPWNAL